MKPIVEWFARNGVAANLLAFLIIAAGVISLQTLKREVFPEVESGMISVNVAYPGAAPAEVEEGVCVKIEESVQSLEGVKKITSNAFENNGVVTIELLPGEDLNQRLDEVKTRVDAIDAFPEESEKPLIQEILVRKQVINIAVSGKTDEKTLKKIAEQIRDELTAMDGITQVELGGTRPYEISIEISEDRLRQYGLTFDEVARAVRAFSVDLPGGIVRTRGGEVLLRTKGQAYTGEDFRRIVVRALPDGSRLFLKDVATVVDGFAETDQITMFDGDPAVLVQVFRVGDQNALRVSEWVHDYVENKQSAVPSGIQLTTWQDDSSYLRSRQQLLLKNGLMGLALVFLTLTLFLRLRLALWVSFGLGVSFLGTFWVMPYIDVSINLLSLFAFILVLGIVVDDAIVVSENIHTHQEKHEGGLNSAISGAQEVTKPVIFAVMTTVAAFFPLLTVPGSTGKVMRVIPAIVIPTLLFSLIESLFILPNHLSHKSRGPRWSPRDVRRKLSNFQESFSNSLSRFIDRVYQPFLEKALAFRYVTLSASISIFLITLGLVFGGWIKFVFFPPVEGDNVVALIAMPLGTPAEVTAEAIERLQEGADALQRELDAETPEGTPSAFRHTLSSVGQQPYKQAQDQNVRAVSVAESSAHIGELQIELAPSEARSESSNQIANRWREITGPIPGVVELTFTASIFSTGASIDIQLNGANFDALTAASKELKDRLQQYPGVFDITDSFREGKREIKLGIKPSGQAAGLTLENLGRQVRQAFYGEEAQRVQRGRDEVKVMVRYPEEDRKTLNTLEEMRIRAPDGTEVPFKEVATVDYGRGYAAIKRVDRRRAVNVTADVDDSKADANLIIADLRNNVLPDILSRHPNIQYRFEGEQREQQETIQGILSGFPLALVVIYALLAIPFKSYFQPLIVMSAIPFGLVGAVWGHVIMGMELTILSMFGIVALAGVVVNDNLVLVDFINRHRSSGMALKEAVSQAGAARFRPILLTSLTTFVGLIPLILEKSVQAKFLIPMAISLAFGVMFATAVSLLLVPAGYLILEDFLRIFKNRDSTDPHAEHETSRQPNPDYT